jgi:SAM-dependent methyltransferase
VDIHALRLLLSPAGQELLQTAADLHPREVDFLALFSRFSRSNPPDLARAALETAILRQEAAVKFPEANHMYFTRQALEQASGYAVARYRAARYRGVKPVFDLGCSIGGDLLALGESADVVGVDLDPLRLELARANQQSLLPGRLLRFVRADLRDPLPFSIPVGSGMFFDPARRVEHRRVYSVHAYQPPLEVLLPWLHLCPDLGVKISPGVQLDELVGYAAEVEFISVAGELKEAALWFGGLKSASRRATLLPQGVTLCGEPDAEMKTRLVEVDQPRAFLLEPDAAVLRAGLVQLLAVQLDAAQLDEDIAYLTADHWAPTPFCRAWPVEAWFPFSLKRLRSALRERRVGRVVIKKRGSPLDPDQLAHDLHCSGDQERVIFLTQLRGRPIVVIALPELVSQ